MSTSFKTSLKMEKKASSTSGVFIVGQMGALGLKEEMVNCPPCRIDETLCQVEGGESAAGLEESVKSDRSLDGSDSRFKADGIVGSQ